MASSSVLTVILSLLAVAGSVSARPGRPFHPCNTLLISTYSVSFRPHNPNLNNNNNHPNRPDFFAVVAEVREFHHPKPDPLVLNLADDMLPMPNPSFLLEQDQPDLHHRNNHGIDRPALPFGAGSLRDRSLDILNVVASLLFGAACGALTAGTMYFVWSLFFDRGNDDRDDAYRSLDGFSDDDDDETDDDDVFNPKKPVNGYVAVPAAAAPPVAVESATADVPAKESV